MTPTETYFWQIFIDPPPNQFRLNFPFETFVFWRQQNKQLMIHKLSIIKTNILAIRQDPRHNKVLSVVP